MLDFDWFYDKVCLSNLFYICFSHTHVQYFVHTNDQNTHTHTYVQYFVHTNDQNTHTHTYTQLYTHTHYIHIYTNTLFITIHIFLIVYCTEESNQNNVYFLDVQKSPLIKLSEIDGVHFDKDSQEMIGKHITRHSYVL